MKNGFLHFRPSFLRSMAVLVLFLLPQIVFSQENQDSTSKPVKSAGYIAKMDTVISVRLNVNNEHERFLLVGSDFK
jgi:hypothetical protein